MKLRALPLLLLPLVACGGGGGSPANNDPTSPGPNNPAPISANVSVRTDGDPYGYGTVTYSFSPSSVVIARGGTVTWTNGSNVTHNIIFSGGVGAPSNIGDHASGSTSRQFNAMGTFPYSCTNHSGMNGSVTVQ